MENNQETPSIILKRATDKDLDKLIELEKSVEGVKTYSAMTEPDEMLAELKKADVFLIEYDGVIVGSVMYEIKSPDYAYISGLVIEPEYQGKGIGLAAMTTLLEGQLAGFRKIDLVTHPENVNAIKLYESLGFVIVDRRENYFGDGEPRVVMAFDKLPSD